MSKINNTKRRVKIDYKMRCRFEILKKAGKSIREIVKETGCPRSTVQNEISNNCYADTKVYNADYAHWLSGKRQENKNYKISKIHNFNLLQEVEKLLKRNKSPKDISMYLKEKYPNAKNMQISHETIYRIIFSYKGLNVKDLGDWYKYLKKKYKKRHKRGYKSNTREQKPYFVSIHKIPKRLKYKDGKYKYGVWEVDTMYLKNGFIVVAVERVSRKILAKAIPDLKADTMTKAIQFLFSRVENVKAIICDRGKENFQYKNWKKFLRAKVYACDPGCPYQKGLVESSIRLMRYWFSRKVDYHSISNKDVYKASAKLNNMYRISLNKKTANQVYNQIKCPI